MNTHENKQDKNRRDPLQATLKACHQAASSIETSFNDSDITPVIERVQRESSFERLRDVKVVIVDDSYKILCDAIPVLVTATNNNATFIYVSPKRDYTSSEIVDAIVAAQPEWVLLDARLGQDFSGPDLAKLLHQNHPKIQCVGFSSRSGLFDGAPVKISIGKRDEDLLHSLREFAKAVGGGPKPLARPDFLVAISILCEGVMLTNKAEGELLQKGIPSEHAAHIRSEKTSQSLSAISTWREVLGGTDLAEKLAKEVGDLKRYPALSELVAVLADSAATQVKPDMATKVHAEIKDFLGS
jgi:hypothetical protein